MGSYPSGTVTFLFTDIEGSTRIAHSYADEWESLRARHNAIVKAAIELHNGFVFQVIGDAFCVTFHTAIDGLNAAIEAQRKLQNEDWGNTQIKVRMGIHTGKAELQNDGQYHGYLAMSRVQRLMSAAHGGQVLISLAAEELLRDDLPKDVILRDMGEHWLKDLIYPERIFQVVVADLQSMFPALKTVNAQLNNLAKQRSLLDALIDQASKEYPEIHLQFLDDSIYTESLSQLEKQNFLNFIEFVRIQQIENPIFEAIYQQLLHLYVLNSSRLDPLKTIERRLRGLSKGQGGLVLISGVSGIGKTSIVMAMQERIRHLGAEFVMVRCSEQESSSYTIWQDLAQSMLNQGIPIDMLSAPIGTGPEAHSPLQLRQSLSNWLNQCMVNSALVILLDDLHWADADSLEMLYQQTNQSSSLPILFIATYRSEDAHLDRPLNDFLLRLRRNEHVGLIQLQPLNSDDIDRLVTAFHGPCSTELADYLLKRSEGHPLFTVELLRDLISQNLLSLNNTGHWLPPEQSVQVPAFLKQLIAQRVTRSGSDVEQLLNTASVAGESWELKVIEPVLDLAEPKLLAALEHALKVELIIVEDDRAEKYRFSHGLIREVLYSTQFARRRKQLHESIAVQLERQEKDNVFSIAHHFYEAENWEKAIQYDLLAGELAVQRFAFFSALRWYQQALGAAKQVGNAIEPEVLLTIYDRLGRAHRALEQRKEAETVYGQMKDVAERCGNRIAQVNALVNLAYLRINQYQFDRAEKTAHEALEICEQTGDLRMLANVHACLGLLFIYRGNPIQATHYLDEAQSRAQLLDDLGLRSEVAKQRGYLAVWAGQYREAENYARISLASAQKTTDPLVQAGGYQNLSWAQIESGKYHEAYQSILTVLNAGEFSKSHHHNLPRLLNLMGYLHLELGDAQTALVWDQKALEASWISQAQGNYEMRRYSLLNIATDYLYLGNLDAAQDTIVQFESIKEAAESVRFRYFNRYQLLMSEMNLAQGSFKRSIELAHEARKLAESNKVLKNVAKSHWFEGRALAEMIRFDEALEHLKIGVELVDEIQHGSLRWKIRLSLAEVLRKAGQSPEDVIQQVRNLIDQIIQSLSGSPLQTVLLGSDWLRKINDFEQSPKFDKSPSPAGLTAREIEVLQLVAKGASNQQVADALHISVRTVNTHMTNILNKTGCDNRTAAGAFAIKHKLVST